MYSIVGVCLCSLLLLVCIVWIFIVLSCAVLVIRMSFVASNIGGLRSFFCADPCIVLFLLCPPSTLLLLSFLSIVDIVLLILLLCFCFRFFSCLLLSILLHLSLLVIPVTEMLEINTPHLQDARQFSPVLKLLTKRVSQAAARRISSTT